MPIFSSSFSDMHRISEDAEMSIPPRNFADSISTAQRANIINYGVKAKLHYNVFYVPLIVIKYFQPEKLFRPTKFSFFGLISLQFEGAFMLHKLKSVFSGTHILG